MRYHLKFLRKPHPRKKDLLLHVVEVYPAYQRDWVFATAELSEEEARRRVRDWLLQKGESIKNCEEKVSA